MITALVLCTTHFGSGFAPVVLPLSESHAFHLQRRAQASDDYIRRESVVAHTNRRAFAGNFWFKICFRSSRKMSLKDTSTTTGKILYAVAGESEGGTRNYEDNFRRFPTPPQEGVKGGSVANSKKRSECVAEIYGAPGSPEEGYVGLFVRLLGLDNPAEDREEAVKALCRHSWGGKQCVDEIVQFPGSLALIVSLLPSDRVATADAATGLLRNISAIHTHRSAVVEAGAVEEITGILTRRSIPPEVREQATCVLWNLCIEEDLRSKIGNLELLPVLVAMLDSTEEGEREASAGVIANLALSESNHEILVEAGVIPKLAKILQDGKGSKVTRQEARNALLELAKNSYYKLSIIEEGMVPVPLIGAGAYQSFKPLLDVAPTLPEDIKLEHSTSATSAFGAGELLLGLNIDRNGHDIDDTTRLAIEGRVRQQFLARIGLLEKEASKRAELGCPVTKRNEIITLMPWWDGIPRLVLILGLEDVNVARQAADTISEIAINEEVREAVQKAGAIPHLVRLLGSGDEAATKASASALERLAVSYRLRRSINAHGAIPALVAVLQATDAPQLVKEKVVAALARLSQTREEVKAMIQLEPISGLVDIVESNNVTMDAKAEAEDLLEEMSTIKEDSRDKIVNANGIPPLVELLASGIPSQKEKAARILENLATKEQHAERIVEAGVESALKATFHLELELQGENDTVDVQAIIQKEETWSAVAAASRLLVKLLRFKNVRDSIDWNSLAILLAKLLKSGIPLYVKDWVSACLLKLERLVGIASNIGIPVDLEITLHDTIPRLIKEIGASSSLLAQERAAVHLRDLVSQGVADYGVSIADSGGIFPLVDLLSKGTPRAQAAALAVLYNLAMNDENHPAILAAGAVTHLQRLVRSGSSLWKLALYLLRSLPT